MRTVVEQLICSLVEDNLPRNTPDKYMIFNFSLGVDYGRFHQLSYHNMDLYFYRPSNYTLVAMRKNITAVEEKDIQCAEPDVLGCGDGMESVINYTEAYSNFIIFAYHDSCWRSDGVGRVVGHLEQNETNVGLGLQEYNVNPILPELRDKFQDMIRDRGRYRDFIPTMEDLFATAKV